LRSDRVPSRLRWRLRATAGVALSRDQRRELAGAWLRIAPSWSDRSIAVECGVSHQTVGRLRDGLDHSSRPFSGVVEPNLREVDGGDMHTFDMSMSTIERPKRRARRRPGDGLVSAVYGGTPDWPASHFIGWLADLNVDALFASGAAFGIKVRKERMLTNSERLDRLERALVLAKGIKLENFDVPATVSTLPAPASDEAVDDEPKAA